MTTFGFELSPACAPALWLFGVTRRRAAVAVDGQRLLVRFGFFRLATSRDNVVDAVVRPGPFSPLRAIGVRYSLADGSITFGSATATMIEVRFARPVTVRPPGLTRHLALWASVADPQGLVAALSPRGRGSARTWGEPA